MNEKFLWKIESLWNEHYRSTRYCQLVTDEKVSSGIQDKFFNREDNTTSVVDAENNYLARFCHFDLVEEFSFTKTNLPVFTDDYGAYYGLDNHEVINFEGKLVYLFDNHNKFLVPLFHLYEVLKRPLKVLHIDAHDDNAIYLHERSKQFSSETLIELLEKTRISDFYDSLSNAEVISEITRITHSQDFEVLPYGHYDILSLDIDIFGPEGDFANVEKKVAAIASAMRQSTVITIATSPGFIDQDLARKIIEVFLKGEEIV